jgi:RNA polymerase sigma factor (sigma-70 family)
MQEAEKRSRFEESILPHLDAAYNFARWLARNDHDAEDIVQEACYRALKYFSAYRGENSRAWLITIVRNAGYDWLRQNRHNEQISVSDVDPLQDAAEPMDQLATETSNPETLLLQHADQELLKNGLEALPAEFREVMILREIEEMSYKEIAGVCDIPLGTVMSRLARGRKQLQRWLAERNKPG